MSLTIPKKRAIPICDTNLHNLPFPKLIVFSVACWITADCWLFIYTPVGTTQSQQWSVHPKSVFLSFKRQTKLIPPE